MPEIVIVDEIGTEAEALACRTIAERGVQLIGTAHGQLLENLIKNPTLSDLVGGITSVTLGDDEARARGTQKSVLERKAPPTFPVVIEMRERAMWVGHWVEDSVDSLLTGRVPTVQVRRRDAASKRVIIEECRYDNGEDKAEGTSNNPHGSSSGSSGSGGGHLPHHLSGSAAAAREQAVADGINTSVFDSMFGYGTAGGVGLNGSFGGSEGRGDDPYAWAARLRDLPEDEALAELAAMGYTDAGSGRRNGGGEKFSFAAGTGSSSKKRSNNRRNSVGRAVSSSRRRR
jgi:hypothetical protein